MQPIEQCTGMTLNKIKHKQDCIHNSTVSLTTHRDTDKFTGTKDALPYAYASITGGKACVVTSYSGVRLV